MTKRARQEFFEGYRSDNPWRMVFGVSLALVAFLRKSRHRQPEPVDRVFLRSGQSLVISTRDPVSTGRGRKAAKKTGRRR